jgi:hypothetical protein
MIFSNTYLLVDINNAFPPTSFFFGKFDNQKKKNKKNKTIRIQSHCFNQTR